MGSDEEKDRPGNTNLRRRAEDRLRERDPSAASGDPLDSLKLLHELQVHQTELEIQNAELRQARDEVEALLEKYTDLFDFAPVGYFTLDREGTILTVNLTGATLLGVPRSRLTGSRLGQLVTPEQRPAFAAFLAGIFAGKEVGSCELALQGDRDRPLIGQIEARKTSPEAECRLALIDVTELQQNRQELLKIQKLESLGVLAGGIAHDFNNLLTGILGSISLARLQLENPGKAGKFLEDAEHACIKASDLTRQLLTFARGGVPVKKTIAVAGLLRETVTLATRGSAVRCDFALAEDLWPVAADEGQLSQVLHNLVLNAIEAMPAGGSLRVTANNLPPPAETTPLIEISLTDTGTGIPAQLLQRIFDPYFTTKAKKNGLGLAICHSILAKHGGTISVTSPPGEGASFHLRLPALPTVKPTAPALDHALLTGQGRILVMDDDPLILDVARHSLEALGYQVECATDGREAFALYRRNQEAGTPFAAVILDLTIPGGCGGKETIALLLELDPAVKAIVSSGYSEDPVLADFGASGFSGALAKPYRIESLSRILHEVLTTDHSGAKE
ncbi:hybrid sensor histidine kinase/response regulator [Desulfuromonas carbonis]